MKSTLAYASTPNAKSLRLHGVNKRHTARHIMIIYCYSVEYISWAIFMMSLRRSKDNIDEQGGKKRHMRQFRDMRPIAQCF